MTQQETKQETVRECVFCDTSKIKSTIEIESDKVMVFQPLNPVVKGHLLVVPKKHIVDFTDDPETFLETAMVASVTAKELGGEYNLITSKGRNATQSVFHLHIHLVPRKENDNLMLPWDTNKALSAQLDRLGEGVEGMKKNESMDEVTTANEVRIKQANHDYNQAIDDTQDLISQEKQNIKD